MGGGVPSTPVSDQHPVSLSGTGLPETVLDPESVGCLEALDEALATRESVRRDAVAAVAARWPRCLAAWASVGDLARDRVEAYAAYRVGYHRGLDRLRQSGWRGSGYVRWKCPENRGFLRCLDGLARMAGEIGESDEQERCELFLRQLDPAGPLANR